jgi:hypothetical protein
MGGIWRAARLAAVGVFAVAQPAAAEFRVRLPMVAEGELALEHNGSYGFDHQPAKRGEQSYTSEVEKAVNAWWLTEFELEGGRDPGADSHTDVTAVTWENLFLLTEPGEYWADFGFFAEYGRATQSHSPDQATFGPIISKVLGPTVNTLNLFFAKDVGNRAAGSTAVSLAWQTRLTLSRFFDPGIEVYSAPGTLTSFTPLQRQDDRAGPVVYGSLRSFGTSKFNYELGYLFGLTRAAPAGTIKWKLEYELRF